MYLNTPYGATVEFDSGQTLPLPPACDSIRFYETRQIPNSVALGDCLDTFNLADEAEIDHEAILLLVERHAQANV
jgi:hypothetical protein